MDLVENQDLLKTLGEQENLIPISALQKTGIDKLINRLTQEVNMGALHSNQTIVTNARHYHALQQSLDDIIRVEERYGHNISGDFLAMDIREALKHLGSIIGEVDTDRDILGNIFANFVSVNNICIL